MSEKDQPLLPFAVLKDLVSWLKAEGVSGMITGGIAASILGRPRVTRDVDAIIIIDFDILDKFIKSAALYRFVPRIKDVLTFAKKARVLLMRHKLPLPTPEDLIIMKAVAHRQRDLIDIESILDANQNLDFQRIRSWVREFSSLLEMPEILDDLERILGRQ